jgi:hypothetical protein
MLKTKNFEFGRDGIIVMLTRMSSVQFNKVFNMCREHSQKQKTRRPHNWDFSAVVGEA